MKHLTIKLPIDQDQLIDDIMANFPEYSSQSLRCVDFDYKRCKFEFWDCEVTPKSREPSVVEPEVVAKLELTRSTETNAVVYHLGRKELRAGLEKLLELLVTNKLPGIASYVMPNVADAGNWDCDAADALVQCAIFGDVIYG